VVRRCSWSHRRDRLPLPPKVGPRVVRLAAPDRRLRDAVLVQSPIRVGDTVRRSQSENTGLVRQVLRHLEAAGVAWAPRALGIDEEEREVLSWIPGETASSGNQVDLFLLAGIVRQLHDLTADLVEGFECVIHDDLQPRNVVVQDRVPVGLIDWEQARPGRRVEDVAKLCWSFIEPALHGDPVNIGERWRDLVGEYGQLETSNDVVATVLAQTEACAEDIEREAARQSVRHQALANRGDHLALRTMHSWAVANEHALRMGFGASGRVT
jgi:tRNA A-37 threonylcarbamoyl transferase component Bud32